MTDKKRTTLMVAVILIFCSIMALVDGVLHANYFTKSAVKLVLFLLLPAAYSLWDKKLRIKPLFQLHKRSLLLSLGLGILLYFLILGGYLCLKNVFDFSAITGALTGNIGVTADNFVFVSLYISFVNSLLEEFFFRGFAFLTLKRIAAPRFAYLFSAAVFSLYHVAMMTGWFSLGVFALVLVGLFFGGLLFNYLNDKSKSIYPSWLVHMFANFAINTIGFMLFGIL